ncbi:MAG: DUF5615 family PIN-like protein [Verrucomicrobia bacterium]|nr:DUF5615 family PIN-like protein [Verrucomicrobiota bacterium]
MRLLLDQHLSFKLIGPLAEHFPASTQLKLAGLDRASDSEVWEYAKRNDFVIVTKDEDFCNWGSLFGYPPFVVWLRIGNTSTTGTLSVLTRHADAIKSFVRSNSAGCLELYG